jgi:hypothetical protein
MNPVQEYWRDRVTNMLQWGAALFVVFAGWALQSHEKFRLHGASWSFGRDQLLAGIGLLLVTVPYSLLFPTGIRLIYKKFLCSGTDATVLPGALLSHLPSCSHSVRWLWPFSCALFEISEV